MKNLNLRQIIIDAWIAGSSAKVPDGRYGDAAHAYADGVLAVADVVTQANPLLPWNIRDAEWMPKVSDAQQAAEMQLYSVPLFGEVKPGPVKLALMCELPGLTVLGYLTATEAPMFRSVQVSSGEKAGGFDPQPPCLREPEARIETALINGEEIVFPLWRKEGIRGLVYATHVRVFMPPMLGYKDIVLPKPILMNRLTNAILAPGTIRL